MKIKNAEFHNNRIILYKNKKDIEIFVDNIKDIIYYRPSFWGFISAYISWNTPGILQIHLIDKVENKKSYILRIKYEDVKKLPKNIKEKIGPTLIP